MPILPPRLPGRQSHGRSPRNAPRRAAIPRTSVASPPKALFHLRGTAVNPYYNLPPGQRATQRLVDQFNADEGLWRKLEPHRRARRRKHRPRLSHKKLKRLDLLEFAKARPPQDCIGTWIAGFSINLPDRRNRPRPKSASTSGKRPSHTARNERPGAERQNTKGKHGPSCAVAGH